MENSFLKETAGHRDYLAVTAAREWSAESAARLIDEMKSEVARGGYTRVLLDLSAWRAPDSEYTRFYSGEYLARMLPPPVKIAAFSKKEEINRLGETVAVNRGAWFRIFHAREEAVAWLMKQ